MSWDGIVAESELAKAMDKEIREEQRLDDVERSTNLLLELMPLVQNERIGKDLNEENDVEVVTELMKTVELHLDSLMEEEEEES